MGKMFPVKALTTALQSYEKKCLIWGTIRITTVQYPAGTTVHSLFHLEIEELITGSLRFNIGRDALEARDIFAANLTIIGDILVVTHCVSNRVSVALQSISVHDRMQFGGKTILFTDDLRQLLPVVPNFSAPVVYRLRISLPYWSPIRKIQFQQPVRAADPA
jgi:hypothetical protein